MTNQEKHQRIYELTRIEPRYWERAEHPDRKNAVVLLDKYTAQKEIGRAIETIAYPHYPCEQLWEMLPKAIKDDKRKVIDDTLFGYANHSLGWNDKTFEIENLLDTLLDMVLWAIDLGYIPCKRPAIDHAPDAVRYIGESIKRGDK